MKSLNLLTLVLLIVGGLNWGQDAMLSRVVYVLVGLSALWQIVALARTGSHAPQVRRA